MTMNDDDDDGGGGGGGDIRVNRTRNAIRSFSNFVY